MKIDHFGHYKDWKLVIKVGFERPLKESLPM